MSGVAEIPEIKQRRTIMAVKNPKEMFVKMLSDLRQGTE